MRPESEKMSTISTERTHTSFRCSVQVGNKVECGMIHKVCMHEYGWRSVTHVTGVGWGGQAKTKKLPDTYSSKVMSHATMSKVRIKNGHNKLSRVVRTNENTFFSLTGSPETSLG